MVVDNLNSPTGLAFDSVGNLYFGNYASGFVLFERSPDGNVFDLGSVTPTLSGQPITPYKFVLLFDQFLQ